MSFLLKLALINFVIENPMPNGMVIWSSRNMVTLARTDNGELCWFYKKSWRILKGKGRANG